MVLLQPVLPYGCGHEALQRVEFVQTAGICYEWGKLRRPRGLGDLAKKNCAARPLQNLTCGRRLPSLLRFH